MQLPENDNISNDSFANFDKLRELFQPENKELEVYDLQNQSVNDFEEFSHKEKMGLKSKNGKVLITPKYRLITFEDFLIVGWLDNIPEQDVFLYKNEILSYINNFENGYTPTWGMKAIKKSGKWGYMSSISGDILIDFKYDDYTKFLKGGFVFAKQNGFYGLIDTRGNEILPYEYSSWHSLQGKEAIVKKEGKWGSINIETLKIGIPFEFYDVGSDIGQKMLMVRKKGKVGFVSLTTCKEQISCIYDDAEPFDNITGVARVKIDDSWHFIKVNGESVNPFSL